MSSRHVDLVRATVKLDATVVIATINSERDGRLMSNDAAQKMYRSKSTKLIENMY